MNLIFYSKFAVTLRFVGKQHTKTNLNVTKGSMPSSGQGLDYAPSLQVKPPLVSVAVLAEKSNEYIK